MFKVIPILPPFKKNTPSKYQLNMSCLNIIQNVSPK